MTALALAGHQRIVLGFSATAYFPGSPKSHVRSPVRPAQPDSPSGIAVYPDHAIDTNRKAVRVSGEACRPHDLSVSDALLLRCGNRFWKST